MARERPPANDGPAIKMQAARYAARYQVIPKTQVIPFARNYRRLRARAFRTRGRVIRPINVVMLLPLIVPLVVAILLGLLGWFVAWLATVAALVGAIIAGDLMRGLLCRRGGRALDRHAVG